MTEPLLLKLRSPVAETLVVSGSGFDRLLATEKLKFDADVSVKTLHVWSAARFVVARSPGLVCLASDGPPRGHGPGA